MAQVHPKTSNNMAQNNPSLSLSKPLRDLPKPRVCVETRTINTADAPWWEAEKWFNTTELIRSCLKAERRLRLNICAQSISPPIKMMLRDLSCALWREFIIMLLSKSSGRTRRVDFVKYTENKRLTQAGFHYVTYKMMWLWYWTGLLHCKWMHYVWDRVIGWHF